MTRQPVDLAELRRLLDEATPGPWRVSREDLARILGPDAGNYLGSTRHIGATATADAALIVATRNALPALLDRLERLEAVAEAARTYRTAVHVAEVADWPDNSPALLEWAAQEYRLSERLDAALAQLEQASEPGEKDE